MTDMDQLQACSQTGSQRETAKVSHTSSSKTLSVCQSTVRVHAGKANTEFTPERDRTQVGTSYLG